MLFFFPFLIFLSLSSQYYSQPLSITVLPSVWVTKFNFLCSNNRREKEFQNYL